MKKILGIILCITFFLPILLHFNFNHMFKVISAKLMHFSFKLWPVGVEKNLRCFFTYRNLAKLLEWSLRAVSMDFSGIFSASVTLLASAAEESIDTVVSETEKDAGTTPSFVEEVCEVVGDVADVAAIALVVPVISTITMSVLEKSSGVGGYFVGFLFIGYIFTALTLSSPVVGFSTLVGTTATVTLKAFGLTSAATAMKAGVAVSVVTALACKVGEALPAETDIPREFASLDSIITRHAREKQDITITSFSDSNDDFPSQPGSVTLESIIRVKRSMKPAALVHPTTIDEPISISISMARAEPLSENVIISSGDNNNDDDSSGGVVNINSSSREPLSENVIISSGDNNNDDDSSGGAVNINSSSTKPLEEDAHAQLPQEASLVIAESQGKELLKVKLTAAQYDAAVLKLRDNAKQQLLDRFQLIDDFFKAEMVKVDKSFNEPIKLAKEALSKYVPKVKSARAKAHEERLAAKARGDLDYDSDSESYYEDPVEAGININKAKAASEAFLKFSSQRNKAVSIVESREIAAIRHLETLIPAHIAKLENDVNNLPEVDETSPFSRDSTTRPSDDNEDLF